MSGDALVLPLELAKSSYATAEERACACACTCICAPPHAHPQALHRYATADEWLLCHYLLLREDAIAPLRAGKSVRPRHTACRPGAYPYDATAITWLLTYSVT